MGCDSLRIYLLHGGVVVCSYRNRHRHGSITIGLAV